MNSQEIISTENIELKSVAAIEHLDLKEELALRRTTLFEPDFNVYADRGSNCLKPAVISGNERTDS